MCACSITREYSRKGIPCVWLDNDCLHVEILAGKGGDITEIRDKRTDVNVLFEAPHKWRPPEQGPVGAPDGEFSFLDHYPGGWQDVLPAAGGPSGGDGGAPLSLHGESPIVPWDVDIVEETPERISLELSVELTRYPLTVERELALEADDPTLYVTETVTNVSEVGVAYSWLQHIALGEPLISPAAGLEVPCERVVVDPNPPENARLPANEEFKWPTWSDGDELVDLRKFPPKEARIHDLVALTDLDEGWYTIRNPDLDLGVTVWFPEDVYKYLWYWQPLGGFEDAPFFGRNYNVGLEPSTSVPNAGLTDAKMNGTAAYLAPDETESVAMEFETHPVNERIH